jgi:prevent-host-death family protein
MADVSVRDLRNRTSDVVERVEAGETITLTVRGRPVADIVPHAQRRHAILAGELIARLQEDLVDLPQGPAEPRTLPVDSDDLLEEVETRRAR